MALLVLLLGSGCSVVLDPSQEQCHSSSDCVARGFPAAATCVANVCEMPAAPVNPAWACLGDVPNPTPNPSLSVSFVIQLTTLEQAPVSGATVDVCDKLDLNCTTLEAGYPKGLKSDDQGNVTIDVMQGFDGFVRVTSSEVLDSRVFVGRPLITPPNVKSVRLISPSDYMTLVAFAHQTVDASRGMAIFLEEDCVKGTESGVSFSCAGADSGSQLFYLIDQAPETPPTATATDSDGFGGFLNLPVGSTVGTATLAATKQYIGQTSFDVLANTVSYVLITPTPQ